MYARISTYEIGSEQAAEAAAAFRAAFERLRDVDGLEGACFLRACEGRRGLTITFWETQAAMTASRVTASRLRAEAAESVSAEIVSVDEYEVAAVEKRVPPVG